MPLEIKKSVIILNGIRVVPSAPTVYLLFADDMLFFRVDGESAREVKEVLNTYCQASGEQINMDKSSIHFAKGCGQSLREQEYS